MTLRLLLAAAAIILAAPAAIAQKTPEATLARFIELANAGDLTTPEGQAILTGEAKQMATEAKSNLPAADKVITVTPTLAAARIVLRGAPGEEADAYFYLEKTPSGWAVSAYRAMAMTGMTIALFEEMKKRPRLSPEDQVLKRNLELTLSPDSQLRAWFTANKRALESLLAAHTAQPAPRKRTSSDDKTALAETLRQLGPATIEDSGDAQRIVIGGMQDNTVGFLKAGPSGPPPISPSEYIWIEDLGGGWYLFRTT